MKIFISHSSRQALFVKELRRRLPQTLQLWIDEHDIGVGENIDEKIRVAIDEECDLFLLVIDSHAVTSEWVQKEIEWALAREQRLERNFLVPIVLDREAWQSIATPNLLTQRKYLACMDFQEQSLSALAQALVSEVLNWLCQTRERRNKESVTSTAVDVIEDAESLSRTLAKRVRAIVHPHRKTNPIGVSELTARLNDDAHDGTLAVAGVRALLQKLKRSSLLNGVYWDGQTIYLAQERYADKADLYRDSKSCIGRVATGLIKSGDRIAIDGGSTTLEIGVRLADVIAAGGLDRVEVFTNSVPVATKILDTLNDIGVRDADPPYRVHLLGGWCRPTSMTTVPRSLTEGENPGRLSELVSLPETFDISFVGMNGLYAREGIGVRHKYEVPAKWEFIQRARRRVIVADASKFLVQQEVPFAYFHDELEIFTTKSAGFEDALDELEDVLDGTSSRVHYCV